MRRETRKTRLTRRKTSFDAAMPDIARGLRASVAMLVPFYLATALGRSEFSWMALGGWLGSLADPGGLRRTRAKALIAFAFVGAFGVALSEWSARVPRLATLALALMTFGAALLRPLGAAPSTIATLFTVTVAIGASRGGRLYVEDGLFFAIGAGWAVVLSSIVWPVWIHLPLRRAIASLFAQTERYANALARTVAEGTPDGDPRWVLLVRRHHRAIRSAVEEARQMALEVRASRPGESRMGSNLRTLLGTAQAQYSLLITLAVELEPIPPDARPRAAEQALKDLAATNSAIQAILVTPALRAGGARVPGPPPVLGSAVASAADGSPAAPTRAIIERLEAVGRAAANLSRHLDAPIGAATALAAGAADRPTPRALLGDVLDEIRGALRTVGDALSPRSAFFRHGLRIGCAVAVAAIVGRRISDHPAWVTVTTIAVLQPYPGATLTRAAHRVVGTVLGSLAAVVITMTLHAPVALAATMFPLSVAAVATQRRSYRLFTFFLTPVFVLLAARYQGDWWTAAARAGDAIVGGGLALVASLVVFPSWEKRRLPEALATTLDAVRVYAAAVLATLPERQSPASEARASAARRSAGVALGDAETGLERLLAEPRYAAREAEDAIQLITYLRRTASALTALDTHAAELAHGAPQASREHLDEPLALVAAYLNQRFLDAEASVRQGSKSAARSPTQAPAPPTLPAELDPHLAAALVRVMTYAGLIALHDP